MKQLHSDLEEQLRIRDEVSVNLDRIACGSPPGSSFEELSQRLLDVDKLAIVGSDRWALSEALRALKMAWKWPPAVEAAEPGTAAYRDASRLIAAKTLDVDRMSVWSEGVVRALETLKGLSEYSEISVAAAALQQAPLVFATTDLLVPPGRITRPEPEPELAQPLTVHLHFTLNDEPVSWPMALQTGASYRFGASATLDDRSEAIAKIQIDWECAAPNSILERTGFSILPDGQTSRTGYLHARAEIPPNQAVELIPLAIIHDASGHEHSARIVGQRSLRVATFAPSEIGAGLPMLSQRIVEMLGDVDSRIPTLPSADRLDFLHLLDATSRFAAGAFDNRSLSSIDERGFQTELKRALMMYPWISRRIREGEALGGGLTDLVLERIVNELKVSRTGVDFESAKRFIGQSTHYASAGDCPISVLTVLDQSKKTEPPGIPSNYMAWVYPQTHDAGANHTPSMVAVVIIPVGFPVPSHWSRLRRGSD